MKKFGLLFFFILLTNTNIYSCCNSETVDDRNNKNLVNDIANKLSLELSIEELSNFLQELPIFLFIFDTKTNDLKLTADALATKVIHSHRPHYKTSVSYTEPLLVGTVYLDTILEIIKDVRKARNIPNIESKCIIL